MSSDTIGYREFQLSEFARDSKKFQKSFKIILTPISRKRFFFPKPKGRL